MIEGNLRLLYDPNQLCSQGERLSEWLLEKVVTEASDVCSPGLGEGLVPSGEPLTIEIAADAAGNQVLQAVLKGRHRAFRILTVTEADAEINGLSSVALARRWQRILQSRVNHARATLTPQRLARRWRLTVVVELILLGLIAFTLWGWTRLRRKVEGLQKRRVLERERRRGLEVRLHWLHAVTRVLMVLVLFELVFAVGLGVMAVPGQIPLGIEVLLQPSFAILKVAAITVVGLLLRALSTFLLHQWADNVDVLREQIALFLNDAQWNHRLLSAPVLRGVRRTTPMGVHLEVLLLTHAGEQWVCEREFQLRVLRAFETAGIQLANGLDLTQLNQVSVLTPSQNSPGG